MAARKIKRPVFNPKTKSDDLPATRRMLKIVRAEIKDEFKKVRQDMATKNELKALETRMNKRFDAQDRKFDQMYERLLKTVKSQDEKYAQMVKMMHNANMQFEQQNADNRIVLDGLRALWERQDKLEQTLSS